LVVVTGYYKLTYFLYFEGFEKNVILISSAALCASATHATDFNTIPQNVSFLGKTVSDMS
jgi:hypothetical protein